MLKYVFADQSFDYDWPKLRCENIFYIIFWYNIANGVQYWNEEKYLLYLYEYLITQLYFNKAFKRRSLYYAIFYQSTCYQSDSEFDLFYLLTQMRNWNLFCFSQILCANVSTEEFMKKYLFNI